MKKIFSIVSLTMVTGLSLPVFAQTNIFPATGKVGIGTTTPTQSLDIINGNLRVFNPGPYPYGIDIDVNFSTGPWCREYGISRNGTGKLIALGAYGKADGTLSFGYIGGNTVNDSPVAPGSPWMSFSPNGMIGINIPVSNNTIVPAGWLDVRSLDTTNTVLLRTQVVNKLNTQMYMASFPAVSGFTGWKNHNVFESYSPLHISAANANGAIYFETGRVDVNTLPRMMIDPAGNVAIGTTTNSKGYKLAVEGTLGARKVKVTSETWADFVFDKYYALPSLQYVEQYIASHGHLEGVPSTAEVVKDGVDVAAMNKILLQKVEELTLYMIELKKENVSQQVRIAQLEKEVHRNN